MPACFLESHLGRANGALARLAKMPDDFSNRIPKLAGLAGDFIFQRVQHFLSCRWVCHQVVLDRSFSANVCSSTGIV
jgi:hypothetical protein